MNTLAPTAATFSDPGPDRAAAVQRQRDAQAGEHQRGGVGDRGLQRGDHRQPAGRVDHPVLGGEAHRGRGRGQHAQPGGRVAQPQAGTVFAGPGPSGLGAGSPAGLLDGRGGQRGERNAKGHEMASGVMASPPGDVRRMTAVMA